jgi:hypothetical protein
MLARVAIGGAGPRQRVLLLASAVGLLGLAGAAHGAAPGARSHRCRALGRHAAPAWERPRRMTVLVDSVLLSGARPLRAEMPCWRIDMRGRPAIMIRIAERELRARGRRVAPLVVVGLGYNSLWERRRRRYRVWARRFDGEAQRLLRTLRRLGARQIVWVTLREPNARTVPPRARGELGEYSWYFPYVNERLRRLDRRRDDLVLADWRAASNRPGLTYDSIHLDVRGGRLMARTIKGAIVAEARRQVRAGS